MKRYLSVDEYVAGATAWQYELRQLRKILNSTKLEETVKWGGPCYTFNGKNVVGMGAFKSYVGLWFFQGALLEDKAEVFVNAQEGKTKALRQWRFQDRKEITPKLIKTYIEEAIRLSEQGKGIKPDRAKSVAIPPQLKEALRSSKKARTSFQSLSRGKQREYADYVADAKRDETKAKRISRIIPMILEKSGLKDQYRG